MNIAIQASTSAIAIAVAAGQPMGQVIQFRPKAPADTTVVVDYTANDNAVVIEHDDEPSYDSDGVDALEDSYSDAVEVAEDEPAPAFAPANALIDRAAFTRAVEIVGNVVERRNTIPILENVALRADEQEIIISGTDLDIEVTARIPAAIDDRFATAIPAHLLKALLKKATASDYVAIQTGDGKDNLDFERVLYTLASRPISDYPDMRAPDAESAAAFSLPGEKLWAALESTRGAISTEESRYYLNGVFLHAFDDGEMLSLRFTATDGHRLYCQSVDMPEVTNAIPLNGGFQHGAILPRRLVELMTKLLKGKTCPAMVDIQLDAAKVRFQFMLNDVHVHVTSKLIDGTFPDYQRVVPADNPISTAFDVAAMQEAINAVSLISSERSRAVRFTISDGKCDLHVNSPENGSATASISCDFKADDDSRDIVIGFNAGYMEAALNIAAGDGARANLKLSEPGNPTIVSGDRDGWFAVLMPMRV